MPTVKPVPSPGVAPGDLIPVVIHYGEGADTRAAVRRGVMAPVGLLRNQVVTVTLLLPPTRAGEPVSLGLYDGGQVGLPVAPNLEKISLTNPGALWVSGTGSVRFNFKAGRILGLYRLLATVGAEQYLLQCYAVAHASDQSLPAPDVTVPPPPTPPPSPTPN